MRLPRQCKQLWSLMTIYCNDSNIVYRISYLENLGIDRFFAFVVEANHLDGQVGWQTFYFVLHTWKYFHENKWKRDKTLLDTMKAILSRTQRTIMLSGHNLKNISIICDWIVMSHCNAMITMKQNNKLAIFWYRASLPNVGEFFRSSPSIPWNTCKNTST